MPGVARIGSHIFEPGVIKQIGNFARLEFAESDGKPSARTAAFHEACKGAGIEATLSPNIQREMWMKFAMLAPLAAMTALTRGPIGPVRANAQIARAAAGRGGGDGGRRRGARDRPGASRHGRTSCSWSTTFPKGLMASMAHDLLAGKPIELDDLSGAVVRLGSRCGVPTPTHKFVTQALAPFVAGKPVVRNGCHPSSPADARLRSMRLPHERRM